MNSPAQIIDTYDALKQAFTENFKNFADKKLFYVEIDRDEIWDKYLSGFSEEDKQEHNCSACRSFLRQSAGIVTITDGTIVSIWDGFDVGPNFKNAIQNIREYIHNRPITDIFLSEVKKCGVDKNLDRIRNVTWQHFYLELPGRLVEKKDLPTKLAQARDDKQVLKRSLTELTLEATETVLELVAQNSLYRGKEFEPILKKFVLMQRRYRQIPDSEKDCFCWISSSEEGGAVSRIRNTAIGTLLIDLSEGMDLDGAVTKFEKVLAPTNYKRPTALVTPRMVEQAKEKLSELGLLSSLERRYANEADIPVFNLLFKDKPQVLTDVFDVVSKDTLINPRSFSKSEEIGIDDFLANVVPTAKSIQVLVENGHLNNFVSLLTAQDPEAPALFKWNNHFSWSYTGSIADSIKERVKAAGGNVVGELRTSLSWSNTDDLDIHVIEPDGNPIFYGNKRSLTSGMLDVDMNVMSPYSRAAVENIIWTDKTKMREGVYKVLVNNFTQRETKDSGFAIQIECNGETFDFEFHVNPKPRDIQAIAEFTYSKTEGIKFKSEVKSNVCGREKWGLKTNRFYKVTQLLTSPNHWEAKTGNKHWFFMLEGCVSDEAPRPFFNEFLKPELDMHRKVLEIVGSKVKVDTSSNQLSGIGFSDTQKSSVIVKVTSKFARTLKINI